MPTRADEDAAKLYTSIMEEAKLRALSINRLTNSGPPLATLLLRECCFLQLRILCELIALGCMVAHGDIAETQSAKLQAMWHAGNLVNDLEKLHPNFYPSPRRPVFSPGQVHLDYYDRGFLTKEDLLTLYGKCSDALHRGNLRDLLNPKNQPPAGFQDIQEWGQKILNLLSVHLISRIGGDFHFVVALEAAQVGGKVLVSIAESPKQ